MIKHAAFIMDGNSTWAKQRGLNVLDGYLAGMRSLASLVCNLDIPYATFYAFSTENWGRPKIWIDNFMNLALKFLETDPWIQKVLDAKVKLKVIGNTARLSLPLQKIIQKYEDLTANNNGLVMQLAMSYGARDEIVRAVRKLASQNVEITEENITNALDSVGIPDPDLIIRTSGKKRLSNFLLWQASYSEFYSTDVLWPDFKMYDFNKSVADFEHRHRTFGLA